MPWIEKWSSGSKKIMLNTETGETRNVQFTKADRESIKRGDLLQPVGKDKTKFLETHGYLPGVPKEETDPYLMRRGLKDKIKKGDQMREGFRKAYEKSQA